MITYDYHTHHRRCGHAAGEIEQYIEAAIGLGFDTIGVSDHAPIYFWEGEHVLPGSAMARGELPRYVDEVLALKERYRGRIRVLLGLEADFYPGSEGVYREVLASHPFDYVIGSVHYCRDFHIYDRRRWVPDSDPEAHYREYFHLVRESARSGLFDVLGHITGIMAFGPQPPTAVLEAEFERTAAELARTGTAVEVNTSGLRKGGPEPFPAEGLLRRCVEAGVPLTYGSDAHRPDEVGHAREIARRLLEGARPWEPGQRQGG